MFIKVTSVSQRGSPHVRQLLIQHSWLPNQGANLPNNQLDGVMAIHTTAFAAALEISLACLRAPTERTLRAASLPNFWVWNPGLDLSSEWTLPGCRHKTIHS